MKLYHVTYLRNLKELQDFIEKANREGYEIVGFTEDSGYTVIYKDE